jgi:hypothetical protein
MDEPNRKMSKKEIQEVSEFEWRRAMVECNWDGLLELIDNILKDRDALKTANAELTRKLEICATVPEAREAMGLTPLPIRNICEPLSEADIAANRRRSCYQCGADMGEWRKFDGCCSKKCHDEFWAGMERGYR